MRIIAGKFRSRTLKAADHFRPTTDRTRETLFNILQNTIPDSVFVDAFAGSGSVGIEAISRGASTVYFIESNRKSLKLLEQNLLSLEVQGEEVSEISTDQSWRILTLDVWKAMDILPQQLASVDIFFFDPPYEFMKYSKLLEAAGQGYQDALFIIEHSSRKECEPPAAFERIRTTRIGETQLSFFRRLLQTGE